MPCTRLSASYLAYILPALLSTPPPTPLASVHPSPHPTHSLRTIHHGHNYDSNLHTHARHYHDNQGPDMALEKWGGVMDWDMDMDMTT